MEVQEITTVETETAPKSNDEKAQAATIEQLEATKTELATTMQALEDIKKAQQGSDQKVAKLLAELDKKEDDKKTDKQRLEELERTNAEAKADVEEQKRLHVGYKEADARELPSFFVDGYKKDALPEYLDKVNEHIDTIVNNRIKVQMANGGHKPSGGAGMTPDTANMSHEELMKYHTAEAAKRTSGN